MNPAQHLRRRSHHWSPDQRHQRRQQQQFRHQLRCHSPDRDTYSKEELPSIITVEVLGYGGGSDEEEDEEEKRRRAAGGAE